MGAGTACGAASCSGSTATPVGACDGAGACKQTQQSCSPYVCGGAACKTTCVSTADCVAPYTCQGYFCTNLKANGTACAVNSECISGHCTEGFCCGMGACPACNSCAVPGKQGTCAPTGDGMACGAGLCDGNDAFHPPGVCAAGSCSQAAKLDCTPYACDATAPTGCKTTCASDADCAKRQKCTVVAGTGARVCGP
jgi:hypothetical protein